MCSFELHNYLMLWKPTDRGSSCPPPVGHEWAGPRQTRHYATRVTAEEGAW